MTPLLLNKLRVFALSHEADIVKVQEWLGHANV